MYKVEVKKAGQFDFEKVDLNIVEQEQSILKQEIKC